MEIITENDLMAWKWPWHRSVTHSREIPTALTTTTTAAAAAAAATAATTK